MKAGLVVAVALTLALVAVACSGGPPDGRTGIAIVDTVLDAVEEGDPQAPKPLIRLVGVPCLRNVPTELEPLCTDDEATGTLVQTFAQASCGGIAPGRTDADELSERIVSQDLSLYAVYEAPADLYIPADYVALFSDTTPDAVRGVGLLIADGQLVGIDQQCGFAPDALADFLGLDSALLVPDSR